jgi:hypothetical protein
MYGDWASTMAINGAYKDAEALASRLDRANANVVEMNEANAGNLGIRCALEEQLRFIDPENPLLNDASLLERIKAASVSGLYAAGNHFDGSREVGRTFRIPGREKGPPTRKVGPASLNDYKINTTIAKENYAAAISIREAAMEQLRKVDPNNPLLKDNMLVERVRSAGTVAFYLNGENFDAAREAGRTFAIPRR